METLEDAINRLFQVYNESCEVNKNLYEEIDEEEINFLFSEENENSIFDLDITLDEDYEIEENEEQIMHMENYSKIMGDILDYFEKTRETDFDLYSDLVSLLALEYYNLVLEDVEDCESYYPEEDNEVLTFMKYASKEKFIDSTCDEENTYLEEIILTILQKYEPRFSSNIDYDYLYLERFFEEKEFQNMYKKFHPNLKKEYEEIKKYFLHSKLLESVSNIEFNKLFDFLYLSQFCYANCEKKIYYEDILAYKLSELEKKNEDLYDQIILYMTQFFYIYVKDKKNKNDLEIDAIETIEEEPREGVVYVTDVDFLIDCFYNYNIVEHDPIIQSLSEDTKKKTKKFIKHYDD